MFIRIHHSTVLRITGSFTFYDTRCSNNWYSSQRKWTDRLQIKQTTVLLRNSILIRYLANSNIKIIHGHLKILTTPSWTNKISNANRHTQILYIRHNRQLSIGSTHNIHWRWNRKRNYVISRHIKAKRQDPSYVGFSALWDSWPLRIGSKGCHETSVRNYHYSLRHKLVERSSHVLRGGRLKLRTGSHTFVKLCQKHPGKSRITLETRPWGATSVWDVITCSRQSSVYAHIDGR